MKRRTFIARTAATAAGAAIIPSLAAETLTEIQTNTHAEDLSGWESRTIYFILIDRFANGDPTNDDFGKGEYGREDNNRFQGGDLAGIRQKLPYIQSLGFDAIWITPPIHNQWVIDENPNGVRGYHGYWAYDFMAIDPHFGTMEEYKLLVKEAHALGIKVIQDIVLNHAGNYFRVEAEGYDPQHPEKTWKPLVPPAGLPAAPNDPLFAQINPNIPEHRATAAYYFTPEISDFNNREQTLTWALSSLNDLNLENEAVRKRLLEIYRFWLTEVGIDGFRVDTVYYTPPEYYEYFLHNTDPKDLGIKPLAATLGKHDFLVFGELWKDSIKDFPVLEEYIQEKGKRRLDSVIDFPLNAALTKVFLEQAPTHLLADCLAMQRTNRRLWVNFVDNHDVERVYNRGEWSSISLSLVCMFTLPGIPCVYYGTEHGFKVSRQNMFAQEYYSQETPQKTLMRQLIALRRKHPAFAQGEVRILHTAFRSGIFAYELAHKGKEFLVIFNTSSAKMLYNFPENKIYAIALAQEMADTKHSGFAEIEPLSYKVLALHTTAKAAKRFSPTLEKVPQTVFMDNENISLRFSIPKALQAATVSVLIDRNVETMIPISAAEIAAGKYELAGKFLQKGKNAIELLVRTANGETALSSPIAVEVAEHYALVSEQVIPATQQRGIKGNIVPQSEATFVGQGELQRVALHEGAHFLRLDMHMKAISTAWNPPNGFDHVYFMVFFDVPNRSGKPFLPRLNYAPADFAFDMGFVISGWSAIAYTAEDATPDSYGKRVAVPLRIETDKAKGIISLYFPKKETLSAQPLRGTKLFIATWDGYLDELRSVVAQPDGWNFTLNDGSSPNAAAKIFSYAHMAV